MLGVRLALQVQRHLVYAAVQHAHDDQRDPVVADGQHEGEERVGHELNLARSGFHRPLAHEVLPADDGGEEDDGGEDPGDAHHHAHLPLSAPVAVLGGDLDGQEAVDGDEEDGVLGGETHGPVQRQPDVAEPGAQRPRAQQKVLREERHGEGADQQVGHSQRRDEVVGRLPYAALQTEGQKHGEVAQHRNDGHHSGQDPQEDVQPQRVAGRDESRSGRGDRRVRVDIAARASHVTHASVQGGVEKTQRDVGGGQSRCDVIRGVSLAVGVLGVVVEE